MLLARTVRRVTRILLVRHGESEWNATGRWQGQADPPLTELGRRQARAAAANLGPVDAIVTSDLERARVTAEILAGELGAGPLLLDADLRERDAGEWSGLTRSDIHREWPGHLPDDPVLRGGPEPARMRHPPGWEPDEVLLARGVAALGRLAARLGGGGEAIAVTHGGLVYAVEAHLGEPWARLPNLGARWVEVEGDRLALGERLLLVDPHDVTVTVPGQI